MTELIPFDRAAAEELNSTFGTTMFRSTEDFINFYNSGMINKGDPKVADFAAEVDSHFKNVKLQGKNLVFISKAEVELDEVIRELHKWEIIAKVRDRLAGLLAEGAVDRETVVCFSDENVGVLEKVVPLEDGNEVRREKLLDEKFFRPADEELVSETLRAHRSISSPRSFLVRDLLDLEDSFISDIHQLLF